MEKTGVWPLSCSRTYENEKPNCYKIERNELRKRENDKEKIPWQLWWDDLHFHQQRCWGQVSALWYPALDSTASSPRPVIITSCQFCFLPVILNQYDKQNFIMLDFYRWFLSSKYTFVNMDDIINNNMLKLTIKIHFSHCFHIEFNHNSVYSNTST